MLVDTFTVIAQIFNFLILVFLLRLFLYRPVVKAMNEREQHIKNRLAEAEQIKAEAIQEKEIYHQKNQAFEDDRERLLHQTKSEVEAWRRDEIKRARQEVSESQSRWQRAVQEEKEAFLEALRQRAGHQVYSVARKVLKDLANAELEEQILEMFITRIQEWNKAERAQISKAVEESGQAIVVVSAFQIPPETEKKLLVVIQRQITDCCPVRFEQAPELISGIELRLPGYKIAWSLASYLEVLEESLTAALEENIETEIAKA